VTNLKKMEISVYELLAAAREAQGVNYVKGDKIFCQKRLREDTAHLVEFLIIEDQSALGRKGEYHRRFLTEEEYQNMLMLNKHGSIQIKKHAERCGEFLNYLPVPGS
jgi:hypothetical protein